ncbi:hypothetical protein V8E54_002434 [Elaphomyces granulatus]
MHVSPVAILAGLALLRATLTLPFIHNPIERRRISYSVVDVDGSSSDQVKTSITAEVVITTTLFHTTTLTTDKETTTTTSIPVDSLPVRHSTSTRPASSSRPNSVHVSLHSPIATPTTDDCQSSINPSSSKAFIPITSGIANQSAHNNNSTRFPTSLKHVAVRPLRSQSNGLQRDPHVTNRIHPSS